jgi:CheY-like chemotaxis protein
MKNTKAATSTQETRPTQIAALAESIHAHWQLNIQSEKVIFTCHIASDVPETVLLDYQAVHKALTNLVSNAVKFTDEGRIHIHITAAPALTKDDYKLTIVVADTGIGMSDDKLKSLFIPFLNVEYGLMSTHKSVCKMGGDLTVISAEGRGSEFTLTLKVRAVHDAVPAAQATPYQDVFSDLSLDMKSISQTPSVEKHDIMPTMFGAQDTESPDVEPTKSGSRPQAGSAQMSIEETAKVPAVQIEQPQPQAHRGIFSRRKSRGSDEVINFDQLKGLNVLIVEDLIANQEILRSLLEPVGCHVSTAENGVEALNIMDTQIFDVVLMDIRMPIMDGVEATRKIRSSDSGNKNVPIIALTADASAENNAQCLAAGADVFLTKPVIVTELFSSIRFVREKHSRRPAENIAAQN